MSVAVLAGPLSVWILDSVSGRELRRVALPGPALKALLSPRGRYLAIATPAVRLHSLQ